MKSSLQSFLYNSGIFLAVAILVTLGALSYRFLKSAKHYDKWEEHTYSVMQNFDGVLADIKDAETGQRGYLITGNEKYLEPYRRSTQHIPAQLEALRQLTRDNPSQQGNIDTIGILAGEKLSELEMTINLRSAVGFEAARKIVMTDKGQSIMDAIRLKIARARDEESSLLQKRKKAKNDFQWNLEVSQIIGGMVSLLLIAAIFILLKRENARRRGAEQKLRTNQERLEETVENRTRALKESEERWATTLASIGDAVIATDQTGSIIFMNRVAEELTGWHFPEAVQKPVQQVFHIISEGLRKPVEDPVARVLKEGVIVGLANHTILVKKDGSEAAIDDSGAPIRDAEGAIRGAVLVFRDISARRSAERALHESEARFRSALDSMLEGCQIIGFDWRYIYLNDTADHHNQRPKEELLGKRYMDMWPGIEDTRVFKAIEQCLVERTASNFENEFVFPDGSLGWFDLKIFPVPEGVFILSLDITRRKKAEAALRESEGLYRSLFENMLDGLANCRMVFEGDRPQDFIYLKVNSAFESLTGLKNVEGRKVSEVIPGIRESDDGLFNIYGRVALTGRPERIEIYVEALKMWFFVSVYSHRKEYFSAIFEVITERKKAEQSLKEANALLESRNAELDSFNYSVSHDLRSPLRAIDAFDKLLQAEYGSKLDGSGKEYLDQISKSISRMAQIIDDLLKLSRITRVQFNRAEIDLGGIAMAVAADLRQSAPEREVEFRIDDIVVQGDAGLMRIVIENLFSNSWKFTAKQPRAVIEFSSLRERGKTLFFVRDNGVGFNMQYSKKLFMPFQRLHANTDFSGTGIGLAIVRRIIERHGGTVCAEGEVGKGATVYFEIPAAIDRNTAEGEAYRDGR